MKHLLFSVAASVLGVLPMSAAHADICADIRAINAQAQSHFDGWKKDGEGNGNGKSYGATFMLDGAQGCAIGGNSNSYSCVWTYATPADLGRAYTRLVAEIKACPPLEKDVPGIVNDKPDDKVQGDLRRQLEVTGFDYGDAQALVMIGSLQLTGPKTGVARNELKFSFVKSSGRP